MSSHIKSLALLTLLAAVGCGSQQASDPKAAPAEVGNPFQGEAQPSATPAAPASLGDRDDNGRFVVQNTGVGSGAGNTGAAGNTAAGPAGATTGAHMTAELADNHEK